MAALEQLLLAGQLLAQVVTAQLELAHPLVIRIIGQDQFMRLRF